MGNRISNTNKDCIFEIDSINKISGIQDIRIIHCKGKKVYLVGEIHTREGSCKPCEDGALPEDTVAVNDYLKIITESFHKKGKTFDMFLENDYVYKTSKKHNLDQQSDAPSWDQDINGMRAYVQNFRVNHPRSTVRFHYVDVRDFLGGLPSFVPGLWDANAITSILNHMLENFDVDHKGFRRNFVDMLDQMYIKPLLNFITKSGLRHGNIVHKQAIKSSLFPDEIAKLQDTFHDLFDSYLKQKKNYLEYNEKEIKQYLREANVEHVKLEEQAPPGEDPYSPEEIEEGRKLVYKFNTVAPLADTISLLWANIHDLYTVFRMFKPYTSCCLFYGGSAHTRSISKMLKLLGGEVEFFIEAPSTSSSCVTLSADKAQTCTRGRPSGG